MSELIFDRKVGLKFGLPNELGRAYTDLRIKFEIAKTSEPTPNKSKISVFNLTADSRAVAEAKGLSLVLSAGYGSTLEDIFSGDIARVITSLEGPDYVTTFEAGDGETAYQTSRLDASFSAGTSLREIFGQAVDALGLALGDVSGIPTKGILNGISLSGLARRHLDNLTADSNLEWSIQDGAVQIIPKGTAAKGDSISLSPQTGLVGIPKKKGGKKITEGIELQCLLQPKLKPGSAFELKSKFISGEFRVIRIEHVGDTHGDEWYSNIEAIEL